jgi:hypothetical protein
MAVHLTKYIYIVFVTGEEDIANTTTGDTLMVKRCTHIEGFQKTAKG